MLMRFLRTSDWHLGRRFHVPAHPPPHHRTHSHIAELRRRIPRRLNVTKTTSGSTLSLIVQTAQTATQ